MDYENDKPEPFVCGETYDTKESLVIKLRAEASRRASIASRMRYGKTRACEFAYLSGLLDAAALIEGQNMYLACPIPGAVVMDGYREDGTPLCDRDSL